MTVPDDRRLRTVEEAAAYVALKPKTLRNMTSAGRGPRSYRVGGRRRFRLADLDAWIDKQASGPDGRAPRRNNRAPRRAD